MIKKIILMIVILFSLFIISCSNVDNDISKTSESNIGMANSASVFCKEQGGHIQYLENQFGTYGVCILPDGIECEEWDYYRGNCPSPEYSEIGEFTLEDSKIIVEKIILDSYQYKNYNSSDLELIHTETLRCPSCWDFIYQFNINTTLLPENILGFQFTIPIRDGKINNVTIFESFYEITEKLNSSCSDDFQCETPMRYLIRSNCPYGRKCINESCYVVCPQFKEIS